jgi:hypothetical protein
MIWTVQAMVVAVVMCFSGANTLNPYLDNAPVQALLTNVDLEEAYAGLDLLNNLLPPTLGILVSSEKMQCSGELVSHGRLNHSKSSVKCGWPQVSCR